MQRQGDAGMKNGKDAGMQGCRGEGMEGCGDTGTRGCRDEEGQGWRDVGTRGSDRALRDPGAPVSRLLPPGRAVPRRREVAAAAERGAGLRGGGDAGGCVSPRDVASRGLRGHPRRSAALPPV